MRTATNLLFISLLVGACSESLPPSPYAGGNFGESTDPITDPEMDSGPPEMDAGANADAGNDGGDDAGDAPDPEQPEIPPLVPKTDCDPARRLDNEFDPQKNIVLASNGKGTAGLSWTSGEPAKQYASTFRDDFWENKQQVTSEAMNSAVLGIDDIGTAYAFWWGETGLTGRRLETSETTWGSTNELDEDADVPVRPLPYVVSPNGISLFLREGTTERSVVRYASDLSFWDELVIEPPSSNYEPDELTSLLASASGQAVVLSTWRTPKDRRLVPYFQAGERMEDADALEIPESISNDQITGVVVPSGDLAVVAAEATDREGRLWVRRIAHDTGKWAKDDVLEERNIQGRRFSLRTALVDARGMMTVAWIDGQELVISQESAKGFSKGKAIAVDNPESAAFALDLDGNVSMVYSDSRGLTLRQLSARDGKLSPPTPVTNHTPAMAQLTHDGLGNVLVVWEEDGLRATTCRQQSVGE